MKTLKVIMMIFIALFWQCGTTRTTTNERITIKEKEVICELPIRSTAIEEKNEHSIGEKAILLIYVEDGVIQDYQILSKNILKPKYYYVERGSAYSKIFIISDSGETWIFNAKNINGTQLLTGYQQ